MSTMRLAGVYRPLIMLALISISAASGGVQAHVNHSGGVSPTLSALPPTLTGVQVQLTETLAPQLLVANPTGKTLIILGQDGQPFLRMGPQGTEANTRHPDWLKTYLPGGLPGRKPEVGTTPLWKAVKSSPNWGWFDARLQPSGQKAGQSWRIPVLLDGKASEIKGSFQPTLRAGYWQASWTRLPALPAGVSLMLIPGQPYGLMLNNQSASAVTVLGRQGEPFIRVSAQGTEVYLASPLWQETAAQQGLRQSQKDKAASPWLKLNSAQRHTWIEPRTRGRSGQTQPLHWEIRLQIGSQNLVAQGVSRWVSKR
ncbi:MAG: hypothetical protein V4730_01900 [Pseudomonadota bacterium]